MHSVVNLVLDPGVDLVILGHVISRRMERDTSADLRVYLDASIDVNVAVDVIVAVVVAVTVVMAVNLSSSVGLDVYLRLHVDRSMNLDQDGDSAVAMTVAVCGGP
jgi:hypothetical protein